MTDTAKDGRSWDRRLRGSYDQEAGRYDERRYRSAEGRLFSALELGVLRTSLGDLHGLRVLDVPAGTGRMAIGLAGMGARVCGGDISKGMLMAAAAKAEDSGAQGVHFAQVNAAHLPFADDTFDAVMSFKFFHLIPNDVKPVLIREMVRVLKPGRKLITEFNSPFYGGVLAFLRYYFRKAHPGGMRMKCIFPDQVTALFADLKVTRRYGVKLPLSGLLGSVVGRRVVESANSFVGGLPGLRYLCYAIIIEAEKPQR
jgi:ubiquinone/menaquinone biosynthesis C-methylase UbiE